MSNFKTNGPLTRRHLLQGCVAAMVPVVVGARPQAFGAVAQAPAPKSNEPGPLGQDVLPRGIRSRFVDNSNGLRMHVLEGGFETKGRPCVVLLHGFPELAFSWRRVMPSLIAGGYHVIAPDLRGYGRTTGWDVKYDDDLTPWRTLNEVRDIVGLVSAFGYRSVDAVVGHDFGSPVAAWCAVVRPDIFRSVVLMSAPFAGTPSLPFDTADGPGKRETPATVGNITSDLAALKPPRKHYQAYYATRQAGEDMRNPKQGMAAFIRAYYHMKSADWKQNKPHPLSAWQAGVIAELPRYYVMDMDKSMPDQVAAEMPSAAEIAANRWLTEEDLKVYAGEYGRTGFQGGLQGYRVGTSGRYGSELEMFSGRTIDQPSMFIAGKSDWGVYQRPGSFERMQKTACTKMVAAHLIEGAGHWVQQEQAEQVSRLLLDFLRSNARPSSR